MPTESRIQSQTDLIESLLVNAQAHITNAFVRLDMYEKRMYELAEEINQTESDEIGAKHGDWLAVAVIRYRLAQRMVNAAEQFGQAVKVVEEMVPNNERLSTLYGNFAKMLDAWERFTAATEALDNS